MIKKMLVALDGSEHSDRALDFALEIAEKFSSEVVLISVVNYAAPYFVAGGTIDALPLYWEQFSVDLRKSHEDLLSKTREKAQKVKPDLVITNELVEGRPADKIIEAAKQGDFDVIFVGSRGIGGIKEFFLGSVSDRVADESPFPVVIVK